METLRILVVDDERPARERLRQLVERSEGVVLAGCCAGGEDAEQAIRRAAAAGAPVHVVFLDVQMPEVDGFALWDRLIASAHTYALPEVVFVTAHDAYAIRAFEAHAIDYLLKPYTDERFHAALDRAGRRVRDGRAHALLMRMQDLLTHGSPAAATDASAAEPTSLRPAPLDKLLVRGTNRVRLVAVDQIRWIEADGMYVKLHMRDGGVHLHRALLGTLDRALDARRFVRIHRSTIVNIDVVDELRQDAHGDHVLVLRDGPALRVGRRFRERLQARLGQPL